MGGRVSGFNFAVPVYDSNHKFQGCFVVRLQLSIIGVEMQM